VDHVLVREDIRQGSGCGGSFSRVAGGRRLAVPVARDADRSAQLCRFPAALTRAVRIEQSEGPAVLAELAAFSNGRTVPARAWRTSP